MGRLWIAGVGALVAGCLVPSGSADAAFKPEEATFTLKYSSAFSSVRDSVKTPKAGCDAERGTANLTVRTSIDATMKVKVRRRKTPKGIELDFFPLKDRGFKAPFPVNLDLTRSERSNYERTTGDQEIEDANGTKTGCTPGPFMPTPNQVNNDSKCRYAGNLFLVERKPRQLQAAFTQQGEPPKCSDDNDGYPGRTNFFPMLAKYSPAKFYKKRSTTLKATGFKEEKSSDTDGSGTTVTTETDKADWTMTLKRSGPWRKVRLG